MIILLSCSTRYVIGYRAIFQQSILSDRLHHKNCSWILGTVPKVLETVLSFCRTVPKVLKCSFEFLQKGP